MRRTPLMMFALAWLLSFSATSNASSVAVVWLNDQFTDSTGAKKGWRTLPTKLYVSVDGKMLDINHQCRGTLFCLIDDFPTLKTYRISGWVGKKYMGSKQYADDTLCHYKQKCALKVDGVTQGYMWIREPRRGTPGFTCFNPRADEDYYKFVANQIAILQMVQLGQKQANPDWYIRGLNDATLEEYTKPIPYGVIKGLVRILGSKMSIQTGTPSAATKVLSKVQQRLAEDDIDRLAELVVETIKNWKAEESKFSTEVGKFCR